MNTYVFDVGRNTRDYGPVEIEAASLKDALEELRQELCEDECVVVFDVERNGGRAFDLDYELTTETDEHVRQNISKPYVDALRAIVNAHDADRDPEELETAIQKASELLNRLPQ